MDGVRPCTLLEELDIEASIVEHRRGELYRLAAKRIRELEAVRPEIGRLVKRELRQGQRMTEKDAEHFAMEQMTFLLHVGHELGAKDGDDLNQVVLDGMRDALRYRWLRAGIGVFPYLGMIVVGEPLDRACDKGRKGLIK